MNCNGIRLAQFQVKLVFNHVPSGLKYNGADLTGEILSTLTEEQARAGMSVEDFVKVQPIIQKAVATVLGIPSTSVQSYGFFTPKNTGAYQLLPKYGPQDENLWATVSSTLVLLSWEVNILDGNTEKPSVDLEITNEHQTVEAIVQVKQTSTPLLGNSDADKSLRSLSVTLPDNTSVTLKYDGDRIETPDYSIEWANKSGTNGIYKVKVTSKIPGTFSFKMQSGNSTMATLNINDGRVPDHTDDEVTGILILPVNNNGWVPTTSEDLIELNRIYQLSKTDTEAKFRIVPAYRNADGTIKIYDTDADQFGYFILPDGSEVELGTELTLSEVGTYTYKYELEPADEEEGIPAEYSEVTLEIKDWQSTVNLEVTPSTGALRNGQATATLRVSSNKPTDTLLIKELVTGDTYKDGDIFTAHSVTQEDKPFTTGQTENACLLSPPPSHRDRA